MVNPHRTRKKRSFFFAAFFPAAGLSLAFLALAYLLPSSPSPRYFQKSLEILRKQSGTVRKEYADLISALQEKRKNILAAPFPETPEEIFRLFRNLGLKPETEGVAYYPAPGRLSLWRGRAVDFELPPDGTTAVVRHKASIYLVLPVKVRDKDRVVFFRLLSFVPQFKTPYLEEYHFLSPQLKENCTIDYWDYREDVSGYENIFARHADEYIGQPRLQNEIQTIFFPLRNEQNKITITVNISSASFLASLSSRRERWLLAFYLLLGLALVFFIIDRGKAFLASDRKTSGRAALLVLALAGLRAVLLPISRLEALQTLRVFSPAKAATRLFGSLSQSPADIFLTSFVFFLVAGCLAVYSAGLFRKARLSVPPAFAALIAVGLFVLALLFSSGFLHVVSRLVSNSNVNLLSFSPDGSFILLHLSLLFIFSSDLILAGLAIKSAVGFLPRRGPALLAFLVVAVAFYLALPASLTHASLFEALTFAVLLSFLVLSSPVPDFLRKKESLAVLLVLAALCLYVSLHRNISARERQLVQNFLRDTAVSQEDWADFLARQILPEIDGKKDALLAFFKKPLDRDLARSFWAGSLLAKFNWHSSLEILDPEGKILSRFSLNIPTLSRPVIDPEPSPRWTLSRVTVPFLGKEKDFLLGYRDWMGDKASLGRIVITLSLDPETLPFLYSANPYYEILRTSSLPSLNQIAFQFVLFDAKGKLLFNPNKISSGLPTGLLEKLAGEGDSTWTGFRDKNKSYDAFCFRLNSRIYVLLLPRRNLIAWSIQFLKLFFLESLFLLVLAGLPGLLVRRKAWKDFLWSFSNRVYASFISITLISLLLFGFFAQNFFTRSFTQRFIEETEVHANFARNIMEDFIYLELQENPDLTSPPEDLVLWISSAISNDVNLYRDGRLVSSSRGEFFDSGLLPELIDGDIYYTLLYENKPFSTGRQKIGRYSFQTLTVPYRFLDSQLLISLPFPFEQQEISRAAQDLLEFLVFVSVFFIAFIIIFARGLGRMIVTPVRKLLFATREVSLGNLEISIDHASQDEMKTLIDGFNAMVKSLKRHQQDLTEMSRKVAWAEMARKVAHEIKNPLTPIQLSAEHLLKVYADRKGNFEEALKESASYIISEVENLRKIAQEFLEISKDTTLRRDRFDLLEMIKETISPYQKMIAERITFHEHYLGADFHLDGDKSKVRIALRNIIINAIEAIRKQGRIDIHLAAAENDLILEIADTGSGMSREVLDRIFELHFSTKEVGTGLGLPIAKKIIEDHGGSIDVWSEPRKGTRVTIRLPRNSKLPDEAAVE